MAHTLNGDHALDARARSRAATLSIVSNTTLIVLKIVAGVLTGSVAILTEALHSGIDLLASFIAFFSVRRAEEPADASHRYGHEKFENAAAAAEGMLILVGSAVIAFAAIRALINGSSLDHLGVGIVVIGVAGATNLAVSGWLFRKARETSSAALEGDAAHLRTDSYTSIGVLVGLALVSVTGKHWIDPVVALLIARRDPRHRRPHHVGLGARARRRGAARRGARRDPPRDRDLRRPRASSATTSCAPARPAHGATSTCTSSSATEPRSRRRTVRRTSCRTRSRPRSTARTC